MKKRRKLRVAGKVEIHQQCTGRRVEGGGEVKSEMGRGRGLA